MGGSKTTVTAPGPTPEELAIQQQMADTAARQAAAAEGAAAASAAAMANAARFQSEQLSLVREAMERNARIASAQLQIARGQFELQQKAFGLEESRFNREELVFGMQMMLMPVQLEQMGIRTQYDDEGQITGFEAFKTPLEEARERVEMAFLQRTEQALAGELPVPKQVLREFEEQQGQLEERLLRSLGPDFATSTPGMRALTEFDTFKAETLEGIREGRLQSSEAMALARGGSNIGALLQGVGMRNNILTPGSVTSLPNVNVQQPGFVPQQAFSGGGAFAGAGASLMGSAMSGLAGSANTFGNLAGLMQGDRRMALDASMFNAQQSNRGGFGSVLGTIAGGFAGSLSGGLGLGMAGSFFNPTTNRFQNPFGG